MTLHSPYKSAGNWHRGSLHIHSRFSPCGWHPVAEVALAYRDYDFLAITDHDVVTTQTAELQNKVLLRGTEVSGSHHMLVVAASPPVQEPVNNTFTPQHYNALAGQAVAAGGLAIANHPVRLSGQSWSIADVEGVPELTGLEVFSGDGIHVEEDVGFAFWDELLSRGNKLWGFGNDDFHHWGQERRVWNVVNSSALTPQGILNALRQGDFYVSSGFGFKSIQTSQNTITYQFIDHAPQFVSAYKYLTLFGKDGQILAEKTGRFNSFSYTATGNEGYIRAEAYMTGGYGAFTQPIFVTP